MRSLLVVCLLATLSLAAALPNAGVCSSNAVQLELRPSTQKAGHYQLAFVALDQNTNNNKADFIDIHYRVNNENSVNLRVLTEGALTEGNQMAKKAEVDGIQLEQGDVIRAYATYASNGIACDTPIHTFNAPDWSELMGSNNINNMRTINSRNTQYTINAAPRVRDINSEWQRGQQVRRTTGQVQAVRMTRREAELQNMRDQARAMRSVNLDALGAEQDFWTQAAVDAEQNNQMGVCPAIAMDTDILKQAGLRDTYVLSFENKTPGKQLHYVDLHLTTDAENQGWDNLRLASDMQLTLAHKVMQPGVVIRPNEALSFYWSYRTSSVDGVTVDCTSPVTTITPQQVTHEVDLAQLKM